MTLVKRWVLVVGSLVGFCVACVALPGGCSPSPEQVEQSEEAKAILKKSLEKLDSGNDEAARQAARARH